MQRRIIVRGARILDPSQDLDEKRCLVMEGGRIVALPRRPPRARTATEVDARGLWLMPGFVDLHVHLREPGHEHKETIETGARAAVEGGFTTIVAMPNTSPPNDCRAVTELVLERARRAKLARVLPAGSITRGLEGKELSDMGELRDAGCVLFTDDGRPVMDSGLMRRALEYSSGLGALLMSHSEDVSLSKNGSMHEGEVSTRLGLRGIPATAEDVMVMRDVALAEEVEAPLHIGHVSTARSVHTIREARRRGALITCECTPHHFSLTEEACSSYDTACKMMPPLRPEADRRAIVAGMRDGTIQAIATDHAPHSLVEKDLEFDRAANGVVGLETAFSLTFKLVDEGVLPLFRAVELLTSGPAKVLGLEAGTLREGSLADIVLVDPTAHWTVDPKTFSSKGRNTPFTGWRLPGRILSTWVSGKTVFDRKEKTRSAKGRA